ncbi:MAG: hypothetical protein KDE09_18575 [Anaerolineales bacterium]|nr:hypothetical protein [Anaerolineales bacterium]
MNNPILAHFTDLVRVPSPSSREANVAAVIKTKLTGWGYRPEQDAAGNILVRLPGLNPEAGLQILASHMDEIGMVVERINPDGSLAVNRSGGLFPFKIGEGPVEILGDEETITGVLSMGSTHGGHGDKAGQSWDSVRILTGLSVAQLAAKGVRPGTQAVKARAHCGPIVFGDEADPLVAAWTFDDNLGCAILLRLLETMVGEDWLPARPTIIAFTISEEIGGLGAKVVALRERPEIFIAVDGSPIPAGVPLVIDGRPGIWAKDARAQYDYELLRTLQAAAVSAGTELQVAAYTGAASDASLVFQTGAAQRVACIGHVRENSHGYEVTRLSGFEKVRATLAAYLRGGE